MSDADDRRRITRLAPHYPVSGWIEAFALYVFAIAVLSVSYVVGQQVGAHPIAFILYAMLVSAVVLLAVTGFGPEALRIMLAPQSWLVGLGIIGIEVAYYILLDYVAPAARQPARAPRHPAVDGGRAG